MFRVCIGVLAIYSIISLAACGDKIPLKLTSRQSDLADTIFLRQAKDLRALEDSLCEVNFDQRVQRAVDSMLILRIKEEEQLRARLRKLEFNDK